MYEFLHTYTTVMASDTQPELSVQNHTNTLNCLTTRKIKLPSNSFGRFSTMVFEGFYLHVSSTPTTSFTYGLLELRSTLQHAFYEAGRAARVMTKLSECRHQCRMHHHTGYLCLYGLPFRLLKCHALSVLIVATSV